MKGTEGCGVGREAHSSAGTSVETWFSAKARVGTIFKKKNSLGNLLHIYISLTQHDAWRIIGSNPSVLND